MKSMALSENATDPLASGSIVIVKIKVLILVDKQMLVMMNAKMNKIITLLPIKHVVPMIP